MSAKTDKWNKTKLDIKDHRALVLWAANCAERVLPYFEKEYPKDLRPRKAIEEARTWVRDKLPMRMRVIRKASLSAHAAARATEHAAARAAARAAGQAVATVHVPGHAAAVVYYVLKAAQAVSADKEQERLYRLIPKHLRKLAFPDR